MSTKIPAAARKRKGRVAEPNFLKARQQISRFNKHIIDFITNLTQTFPEEFTETNANPIKKTLGPLRDENVDKMTIMIQLRNSETHKYMLRFYKNIENLVPHIKEVKLDLFDREKKSVYKPPPDVMWGIPVNFTQIWEAKETTDTNKKVVLTYLKLLVSFCETLVPLFKITKDQRREVIKNRKKKDVKKDEMMKHIYNIVGEKGNKSIDTIVNDIMDDYDGLKQTFTANVVDGEKVQSHIEQIYKKVFNRYQNEELSDDQLMTGCKNLFNNVMEGDDEVLKDNIGAIMDMVSGQSDLPKDIDENDRTHIMSALGKNENFKQAMEQIQKGENPIDILQKIDDNDEKEEEKNNNN